MRAVAVSFALALLFITSPSSRAAEHWQRYAGPWGADVRALAQAPEGTIYCGVGHHDVHGSPYGKGGGLWASNDGQSWARCALQGPSVAGIAVFQGSVFVATFGDGVWRSDDGGTSWEPLNEGLGDLDTRCIMASGGAMLLGATAGFFYLDSSSTWQPAATAGATGRVWAMAQSPWDPATIIAATDSAAWKSTDGGTSWAASGTGMIQRAIRSIAIGSDGRCWAGSFDRWNGYAHLYCSADSGATWSLAYEPGEADAVWSVMVWPQDPDLIIIGAGCLATGDAHIHRSDDGGGHWTDISASPLPRGRSIRVLLSLSGGNLLAGCESSGGVLLSPDAGMTWSAVLEGLDAANVHAIARAGDDLLVGRGFSSALARGVAGGQSWIDMDPGFPSLFVRSIALLPGDPERILTAAWNDGYLSVDGGEHWVDQDLGTHGKSVATSPSDPDIVYYRGDELYVTRDGCMTWEGPDTILGDDVTAVAADPRDGSHAFASAAGYLFETHDAAATWDTVGAYDCSVISFHAVATEVVCVGTGSQGVYMSTDGGTTFEPVSANLADQSITAMALGPTDAGVIWAGTPTGVHKTLDGGGTWAPDNAGLENRHVLSLNVDLVAWRIRVGTYAGGISWSPIDHQGAHMPPGRDDLRLAIAPVPSRGVLSISPFLADGAARGPLDIALYSLGGRLIRRATFNHVGPCVWDLSDVPSGAYSLRGTLQGTTGGALVVMTR